MNEELAKRWNELVRAKEDFLNELKGLSDKQLSWKPAEGWSINQVIEHIISAETGTVGYMKKKSSSGWDTLEVTGEEHIEKSKAINARLASPERYMAPSVLPNPTNNFSYNQLTTQWNRLREELEEFISAVETKHYDKLVFRQPAAGMLNLLQTIEFMYHHIMHHIPQLQRIKAEQDI